MADEFNVGSVFFEAKLNLESLGYSADQATNIINTAFEKASRQVVESFQKIDIAKAVGAEQLRLFGPDFFAQGEKARDIINGVSQALKETANARRLDQEASQRSTTAHQQEITTLERLYQEEQKVAAAKARETTQGIQSGVSGLKGLNLNFAGEVLGSAEDKFRSVTQSFNVVSQAYDKGLVSAEAFTAAQGVLSKATQDYDKVLQGHSGTVTATQVNYNKLGAGLLEMGRGMGQLGTLLSFSVTAPLVAAGTMALKFAGQIETAELSLTRMLGSRNLAESMVSQLRQFSLTTPFEFKGSLEAFRKLNELGFAAKNVIGVMKTLGDTVAAVGGDTAALNRLVLEMGKLQQSAFVTARDINILQRNLIPARELLAEGLSVKLGKDVSTADVGDMIKKKLVSGVEGVDIILKGLAKRYNDEMAVRSTGIEGLFTNTKEKIGFVLADLGKVFLPFAKDFLKWTFDALDGVVKLAHEFAELPKWMQTATVGTLGLAAASGPLLLVFGKTFEVVGHLILGYNKLFLAVGEGGLAAAFTTLSTSLSVAVPLLVTAAAIFVGWQLAGVISDLSIFADHADKAAAKTGLWQTATNAVQHALESLSRFLGSWKPDPVVVSVAFKIVKDLAHTIADEVEHKGGIGGLILPTGRAKAAINEADSSLFPQATMGPAALANIARTSLNKTFEPEITPGGLGITNAFKALVDDAARKIKPPEKPPIDTNALPKAFSTLGVEDFKTELAEANKALELFWSHANPHQRFVAVENLIDLMSRARDAGVLSDRQFEVLASNLAKRQPGYLEFAMTQGYAADAIAKLDGELQKLDEGTDKLSKTQRELQLPTLTSQLAAMDLAMTNSVYAIENYQRAWVELNKVELKQMPTVKLEPLLTSGFKESVDEIAGILKVLNVSNKTAALSDAQEAFKKLNELTHGGTIMTREYMMAYDNLLKVKIEGGQRLTVLEQLQMEQIERQINKVSILQGTWRRFSSQVSTIISDLGKGIMDIFFPLEKAQKITGGLSDQTIQAFQSAFNVISSQGFSDPKKALQEIIDKIKQAGSIAEANTLAIKYFGDQAGPGIARALRDGTLSLNDLNTLLGKVGDQIHTESEEVTKASKLHQLWEQTIRSVGRAFIESAAKGLAEFSLNHLKPFMKDIEILLARLPLIGGLLGKIFNVKASDDLVNVLHLPSIGGGSAGGVIEDVWGGNAPGIPGGIGSVGEAAGSVGSTAGSVAGSAGGAAGSVASSVGSMVSTVASVVGAVGSIATAVITGMTAFHANTLLSRIEESTRAVKAGVVEGPDSINNKVKESYQQLLNVVARTIDLRTAVIDAVIPNIESIEKALSGPILTALHDILSKITGGSVSQEAQSRAIVTQSVTPQQGTPVVQTLAPAPLPATPVPVTASLASVVTSPAANAVTNPGPAPAPAQGTPPAAPKPATPTVPATSTSKPTEPPRIGLPPLNPIPVPGRALPPPGSSLPPVMPSFATALASAMLIAGVNAPKPVDYTRHAASTQQYSPSSTASGDTNVGGIHIYISGSGEASSPELSHSDASGLAEITRIAKGLKFRGVGRGSRTSA